MLSHGMKSADERGGMAPVLGLVLAAVVAVVGFFGYRAYMPKTSAPLSQTNQAQTDQVKADQTNALEALGQVKAFYKDWLSVNGFAKVDTYVSQGYLTAKAGAAIKQAQYFDPVTCGQQPLTYDKYGFTTSAISENSASVAVTGTYDGPPATTIAIKVDLVKTTGSWAIDKITCPAP